MSQVFWFSDGTNKVLRKVDASGVVTTPVLTSSDGLYIANGGFANVWGACFDSSGNIFVIDEANGLVYKVDTSTLIVTRVAGGGGGTGALAYVFGDIYYVIADAAGNLYISDSGFGGQGEVVLAINMQGTTQTLFGVSIAAGGIAVIAGTPGVSGYSGDGGAATAAKLSVPFGLALDGAGNLYIVDQFSNTIVRKVTPAGIISTFAGTPLTQGFTGDGSAPASAQLARPLGVQLDAAGNIYITDSFNECIRVVNTQGSPQTLCAVSVAAGTIQTVAGVHGSVGYGGDGGPALSALLGNIVSGGIRPWYSGLAPNGDLYICDTGNFRIRKVDASTGIINTVAGTGTQGYTGDGGAATSARIGQVFAVLFPPSAPPAVTGVSFPSSEVVAAPTDACGTDPRIASRQFLFGLPGKLVPFSQANIYSINRRTGLRGDGSTGGVLTILYSGTLAGDLSEVLIQDAPDESVNGLFTLPTTAAWGPDGVHSLLQFEQDGPDLTVFGGLISSLTGMLSVAMIVPDVYDDDGIGFDTTYQPWFAQLDMKTLRFGGYRGQLEGVGQIDVTPVAEDSTLQFQTLSLEMHSGTVQFEGGMLFDGSYCSTRISNGARAGSWFSVKLHKMYAALLFEAQP
jgi:hypothetical protein